MSSGVNVLVGPVGTGKSFTVARLAELWREQTGTPVVGLTTSQNAAWVLARPGLWPAAPQLTVRST
nr:AAA family ATPase [Actinoallomurus iriomotensis]